jgi:hypothetical protein
VPAPVAQIVVSNNDTFLQRHTIFKKDFYLGPLA